MRRLPPISASALVALGALAALVALLTAGCDAPRDTDLVLDNGYGFSPTGALTIYRARWAAVSFAEPVLPGDASTPHTTVPASANDAYVLLAPGWEPSILTPPTSFVLLASRHGFEVALADRLEIHVDDDDFAGDCAAGSTLGAAMSDFLTGVVFSDELAGLAYDRATCSVSRRP